MSVCFFCVSLSLSVFLPEFLCERECLCLAAKLSACLPGYLAGCWSVGRRVAGSVGRHGVVARRWVASVGRWIAGSLGH